MSTHLSFVTALIHLQAHSDALPITSAGWYARLAVAIALVAFFVLIARYR